MNIQIKSFIKKAWKNNEIAQINIFKSIRVKSHGVLYLQREKIKIINTPQGELNDRLCICFDTFVCMDSLLFHLSTINSWLMMRIERKERKTKKERIADRKTHTLEWENKNNQYCMKRLEYKLD